MLILLKIYFFIKENIERGRGVILKKRAGTLAPSSPPWLRLSNPRTELAVGPT